MATNQAIQVTAKLALASYGNPTQLPAGWSQISDLRLNNIDNASGYQAKVYVNSATREIIFANTGTNDKFGENKDKAAWNTVISGDVSNQVKEAIQSASIVKALVQTAGGAYENFTVTTTGHSWGGTIAQVQANTFGWKGTSFDAPGAGKIVGDASYTSYLQSQGITPAGATDFTSCKTGGFALLGGSLVSEFGTNMLGISQCQVDLPSNTGWTLVNGILTIATGGVGFALGKIISGVAQHGMQGIDAAVQNGLFHVTPVTPAPTTAQPISFSDEKGTYTVSANPDHSIKFIYGSLDGKPTDIVISPTGAVSAKSYQSAARTVLTSESTIDTTNTCRREDYTTTPAGEAVVTKFTFVAGFDSQLAHKETSNTNAAGTVSTLAEDQNGDGIVDKTTTKTGIDSNGYAQSTTVAIAGGDTTTSLDTYHDGATEKVSTVHADGSKDVHESDTASATWTSQDSRYDAQGKLVLQTTYNDDGSIDQNTWNTVASNAPAGTVQQTSAHYAPAPLQTASEVYLPDGSPADNTASYGLGAATSNTAYQNTMQSGPSSQTIVYKDGTSQVIEADVRGKESWGSKSSYFNDAHIKTTEVVRGDDGYSTVNNWDTADQSPLANTQVRYDAKGKEDYQKVVSDNGSYFVEDWDEKNTSTVAATKTNYDAQDSKDYQTTANDDRSYTTTDWDQANTNTTASIETNYDTKGRADTQTVTNDDGSRVIKDWDQSNASTEASTTTKLDANNLFDSITTNYDNGTYRVTDFDQASTQSWSQMETYYAAGDALDDQWITYDDFSQTHNDWDQSNANTTALTTTTYDPLGNADSVSITYDNNTKFVTLWDQANTQTWSSTQTKYTASGDIDIKTTYKDDGSVNEIDWDRANESPVKVTSVRLNPT
jgi:hypothetical protein